MAFCHRSGKPAILLHIRCPVFSPCAMDTGCHRHFGKKLQPGMIFQKCHPTDIATA
jgi:hypothetical protein